MILIGDRQIYDRWAGGIHMRPVLADNSLGVNADGMDMSVNATLRKDEWEIIDARVNEEARHRLRLVEAFRSRGLIQPVGVGDIERVTERLEAFTEAQVSFDADTRPEEDKASYLSDRRAIPIISHGFRIGFRQLASSERRGANLQADTAGLAARAVTHQLQALITNGIASGAPSGGGIPGLTTATNAIDVSLATAWNDSGGDPGGDPIGDTERMLEAAYAKYLFGPFVMFTPKNYWAFLQGDYKDYTEKTYLERIRAFEDIADVIPLDDLSDDNVLLVQMTRDVMDISEAMTITTWQWQKTPAVTHFRVLAIMGPHIKSIETQDGDTINGIIHLS
jgi:hypothetical protein